MCHKRPVTLLGLGWNSLTMENTHFLKKNISNNLSAGHHHPTIPNTTVCFINLHNEIAIHTWVFKSFPLKKKMHTHTLISPKMILSVSAVRRERTRGRTHIELDGNLSPCCFHPPKKKNKNASTGRPFKEDSKRSKWSPA